MVLKVYCLRWTGIHLQSEKQTFWNLFSFLWQNLWLISSRGRRWSHSGSEARKWMLCWRRGTGSWQKKRPILSTCKRRWQEISPSHLHHHRSHTSQQCGLNICLCKHLSTEEITPEDTVFPGIQSSEFNPRCSDACWLNTPALSVGDRGQRSDAGAAAAGAKSEQEGGRIRGALQFAAGAGREP